jgi:hypothetical protein
LVFTTTATDLATPLALSGDVILQGERFEPTRQILRRDLDSSNSEYASHLGLKLMGVGHFTRPLVSDAGRFVAYNHSAPKEFGGPDFSSVGFVSDLQEQLPGRLLPVASGRDGLDGRVFITWLAADGSRALIESNGVGDAPQPELQGVTQIYLRELMNLGWSLISRNVEGAGANGHSGGAVASRDLSTIVFWSQATDLVLNDTNNARDVFVVDRIAGTISRIEVKL